MRPNANNILLIQSLLINLKKFSNKELKPTEIKILKTLELKIRKTILNINKKNKKEIDLFELANQAMLHNELSDEINLSLNYFFANLFLSRGEKQIACSFAAAAEGLAKQTNSNPALYDGLANIVLSAGFTAYALDLLIYSKIHSLSFTEEKIVSLKEKYDHIRSASKKKQSHGHHLLINYLSNLSKKYCKNKVLVEIGTTREQLPGQGSTKELMEICQSLEINFITVDMDPNNTLYAKKIFDQNGYNFQAINSTGEEYLQSTSKTIDFIFLDAYDFEHFNHSNLRQERYIKYLGSKINEEKCHKMHLECAKALVKTLAHDGIICIDDTWKNKLDEWQAKGKLAVPFLLENGFEIVNHENKSILLKRKT